MLRNINGILCYYVVMNENLTGKINSLRQKYREIFKTTAEEIQKRTDELKPTGAGDIFDSYDANSEGAKWQTAVLKMFEDDISKDIIKKWAEILAYRDNFKCKGCAVCCNLACSEFSPEELKQKALSGDNFANQFLGIFVPYNSKDEASKIYPDYIKLLDDTITDPVYFYHCPKLSECKRCTDYENRPQICRNFPDNPLSVLPDSCGFYEWKREVEPVALMLHAMVEIMDYYKQKIELAQKIDLQNYGKEL